MEPPVFATQGEAAGKHKGRKPKAKASPKTKSKAKGDGKAQARSSRKTKATPKAKAKGKATQSRSKVASKTASKAGSKVSRAKAKMDKATFKRFCKAVDTGESSSSSSKPDTEKKPQESDTEKKPRGRRSMPVAGDNEPRVPPAHVTHNHIYSSAYRKALSANPGNKEHARSQGHAAVDFFKLTGTVNNLCGQFRETVRTKRGATD